MKQPQKKKKGKAERERKSWLRTAEDLRKEKRVDGGGERVQRRGTALAFISTAASGAYAPVRVNKWKFACSACFDSGQQRGKEGLPECGESRRKREEEGARKKTPASVKVQTQRDSHLSCAD